MRILLHSPMHYEYATELASALSARDDITNVTLVVCADFPYADRCNATLQALYVDYRQVPGKARRLLSHVGSLLRLGAQLITDRPDVLHVQALRYPELDWPLLVLARALRIPVVWTAHNSLPHERRAHHRLLYGLIYRLSNRVIVHTRHTADALEAFGVAPDRINTVAHGNLKRMTAATPSRVDARRMLGISAHAFVLYFFGRIRPYKGLDLLIAAVAKLDDPSIVLIIAGEDLFGEYADTDLGPNVRMDLRRIDDTTAARYFAACDLVALPYRRIDQSGVLMLAMSYGCPVLATRVGGLAEVLEHDRTGFLVAPDDSAQLAAEISRIRNAPSLLEAVQAAAAREIDTTYGWPQLAAATMQIYAGISR